MFVPQRIIQEILILQQYLETAVTLLLLNQERTYLKLVRGTLVELSELILIKNCAVVKPFFDHLMVQTADNLINILLLIDDKPDVVLLYVDTNDILSDVNDTKLANNIINIALN